MTESKKPRKRKQPDKDLDLDKALDNPNSPIPKHGDGGNLELWDDEFKKELDNETTT